MKTFKLSLSLICLALLAGVSFAQDGNGTPGDGIPDIYYAAVDTTVPTSIGDVFLPQGWVTVDTDGTDMVALLIGGDLEIATVGPTDGVTPGCELCNQGRLPDPNAAAPLFASDWTTGFINGSNQWVRTNPLDTLGFAGVIGDPSVADPFTLFPDTGLAYYGDNPQFTKPFVCTSCGADFNATYATLDTGTLFVDVTTVPEPASMSLFGMAILGLFGLRRRS